jgi:N-acyl-L-homoserine lactone synthetase
MSAHLEAVQLDYTTQYKLFGRFRQEVFADQLGWVSGDVVSRLELDQFDPTAYHLGVYTNHQLVGYVRIVVASQPHGLLMQQGAFRGLSPPEVPAVATIAEVSRLGLAASVQHSGRLAFCVLQALFIGIYDFCIQRGITELYAIADDVNLAGYNHVKFLTKHLGFEVIGTACQLAPGVDTKLLRLTTADALQRPNVQRLLGIVQPK